MCSVIGMIGHVAEGQWTETHAILTQLLRVSECRGTDATGFAAITRPFKPGRACRVITDKAAVRASKFIEASAWRSLRHQRCSALIGHTRFATRGDPRLRLNAHPFAGGPYHLVHNGVLTNDLDVADEYGLRIRSQTDSEVLVRLIEAAGDPQLGLDLCLRRVTGTMAIALLDAEREAVWLARRDRPLWLCRFRRQRLWWFASTPEILFAAFESVLGRSFRHQVEYLAPIPESCPLMLLPDGYLVAPDTRS